MHFAPYLLLLLPITSPSTSALLGMQEHDTAPAIESGNLGGTRNVHRSGDIWFSGQFGAEDIAVFKAQGIVRVINARPAAELAFDEQKLLEEAGLEYVSVPFSSPDTLTDAVFDRIRALLGSEDAGPTLFHCGSANRVGGAWLPYRVLDQDVPLEQALSEARTIGMRTPGLGERAIDYIERMRSASEQSVNQGINDSFKDPDLDVGSFVARFEVESREVFTARDTIVAALGVEPGMRVADVGAGTGLFSLPLSRAVGPAGWIFAVDIAPRFLQHIQKSAEQQGSENIGAVLCSETSIGLPPESVDLVYLCDTYHHFEYPSSTLASILRALRPGGRFIVIDFERLPDSSSEWILGHIRAGKDVFRGEIEAAGFELLREAQVEGLVENYFLEFRKPLH
ncbi:MAG: hypothetical protein ACI8Y8_003130 [Planctomycetota bacterium]|jgi:uncharacterized protein (TIGR01244 family)